jgi:sodium transport system permease protein
MKQVGASLLSLVGLIYRKEMLETLRDRRTLIVMVLLPLALYPLIGVGLTQYISVRQKAQRKRASTVLLGGARWARLEQALERTEGLQLAKTRPSKTPAAALRGKLVDAVVEVPQGIEAKLAARETVALALHYDETRDSSRVARGRVKRALKRLEAALLRERLSAAQLKPAFIEPVTLKHTSIASSREVGSYVLARVLPLLVILMVLLGAFYPAIDLTAGEKERGTLETLLIAPVPRLAVIIGKFLVVTTIAIATGLLNLTSIGVTLGLGFGEALRAAQLTAEIPWSALAMTLVALVPAAAFFAAIMVAVASLARSFKEAQNLLTPVYLVCMMPAFASQLPGFELDVGTALVPAVNVSLLTRDLIAGNAQLLPMLIALISTSAYALIALAIGARIYNSERLLFAGDAPIWRRKRKRKPVAAGPAPADEQGAARPAHAKDGVAAGPAPADEQGAARPALADEELPLHLAPPGPKAIEAGLLLMLVMALVLLVGVPLQGGDIVTGMLVTEWALIAVPVLLAIRFGGHDLKDVLSLRRPSMLVLLGALMAGISGWYLVSLYVEHVQQHLLPMPKEFLEGMQKALFAAKRPLIVDLVVLAISPAICEELLFRGFLLRSSRPTLGAPTLVLLNAMLFGLFHLSIYRFVPTAALGAILTLIALRSGSIYPAMLFHVLNNAVAIVLGRTMSNEAMKKTVEAQGLWPWLPAAVLLFAVGLWLALRRPNREEVHR